MNAEESFWVKKANDDAATMRKGYEQRIAVLEKACRENEEIIAKIGQLLIQENRVWISTDRE